MGLDMYFMNGNEEIYYYRKHADLNGLLEKIWKKDHTENFNCSDMEITDDVVKKIEEVVNSSEQKKYTGFFWGESTKEQWADTKNKLIPLLKEHLRKGDKITYLASW